MYARLLAALLLVSAVVAGGRLQPVRPPSVPDFTFIHCSDVHVPPGVTRRTGPAGGPQFGSAEVVRQIKGLTGPIELKPYGVTVPPPSFAISTGDLTEFGGLSGWWEQYVGLWHSTPFPVFHESGNHDSTWACQRYRIREMHGGPFYSFNRFGCHFIGWDSATPQDPRPSFGQEGIEWLREDLRTVARETPIFLFCHHPIDSGELASLYERDRLLDLLRPYNLTLFLVGHGHAAQHRVIGGVDQVMGGSTFGPNPGYSVVSVRGGVLRVAYRRGWEDTPTQPLLERPLPTAPSYPRMEVHSPSDGATLDASLLRLRVRVDVPAETATWLADDEKGRTGELRRKGREWQAEIDTAAWEPGCHYLRVVLRTTAGQECQRTVQFYTPAQRAPRVLWRAFMGGSGKGSPAVEGDLVVAGAGDGFLYAFGRKDGKLRWKLRTGGEILARPLVAGGLFIVGSGDGNVYAVDAAGRRRWTFAAGYPVYSPAVQSGEQIIVAANNGRVYALNIADGGKLWESTAPTYAIESRPFVKDGTVYYGAWDTFVYAFNLADGSLRWKTPGAGSTASAPGVARYYSPADAGPVVAGGRVWIADRAYRLTLLDAATGRVEGDRQNISSVALSEDGRAVYLRGTDGNLRKAAADGGDIWTAPARTSFLPSAPAEKDGVVYSASATGRLVALGAADGKPLWEYQVTPRLYVFSDPVPGGDAVFVTGMDGSVTALSVKVGE